MIIYCSPVRVMLFSKDPMELQSLLDKLYAYSMEWGLEVNIRKTKVCVFEYRRTQRNQRWHIHGEPLETVDSFCYIGMKFYYNGNLV